jgi:hypothetical protein
VSSWTECDAEHVGRGVSLYKAAIALSKGHPLLCAECRKPLRMYHEFAFANAKGEKNCYEVTRIARLYTRNTRKDGYDPFLFRLQHCDDLTNVQVWPVFWAPGRKGRMLWGQFSPLLSQQDWKKLFRKLAN